MCVLSVLHPRVCYERCTVNPTAATFLLSAMWHGVYPGYYLTFLTGIVMTMAARAVSTPSVSVCTAAGISAEPHSLKQIFKKSSALWSCIQGGLILQSCKNVCQEELGVGCVCTWGGGVFLHHSFIIF